jgi:hypothetical protein
MESSGSSSRILIVAHRTATTPGLLEEVRRHVREGTRFDLLVPDVLDRHDAESTLALALPVLRDTVGSDVEGIVESCEEPLEAVKRQFGRVKYDEVIVSTLPLGVSRWLKRDLPRQVSKLGVPVTVVTAVGRSGAPTAGARAQ